MNPEDLHAGAKMDLHTGAKMDLHKGAKIHGYREGGIQCICTASSVFAVHENLCLHVPPQTRFSFFSLSAALGYV